MPLLQPPITGDNQLDSWTYRLTQSINNGLLPGVGGGPVHGDTDASGSGGTVPKAILFSIFIKEL